MGVKKYKPTSAGLRARVVLDYQEVTTSTPLKSLTVALSRKAGRNNSGKITVRHREAGVKRLYRIVDFKRSTRGVPAVVTDVEYDPYRTAHIARLSYRDGSKSYILCPVGLRVGDTVMAGPEAEIRPGNALPLKDIPVGSVVHNVELHIGKGAQLGRSAGAAVTLAAKTDRGAIVKLPSGEMRIVNLECYATVGQVGNVDNRNRKLGKAGVSRWLGRRPSVRGAVMNPCDHPHGGGEGKAPVGRSGPMTPWGKPAMGLNTRNKKKPSSKFIIGRRK
jgi:large subunit ribosomal protein L2